MPVLLWDESALSKRYVTEVGTETVNELFLQVSAADMVTTVLSFAETCSVLNRRRNGGSISATVHRESRSALRSEVVDSAGFRVLDIKFADYLAGVTLLERHNLNASDAAVLNAFLRFADSLDLAGGPTLLVASDVRLLRAAQLEGIHVLNPEAVAPGEVAAILASVTA